MEHSYSSAHGGSQHRHGGRKSTENPRLQKKRSTGRARSENLAQPRMNNSIHAAELNDMEYEDSGYQSRSDRPQSGQRKGSLRNVVRRIFGRSRSKEPAETLPTQRTSSPKHKYHKSEPPQLPPQLPPPPEQPEYDEYRHDLAPQRIFSAPLQIEVPSGLSRVRSPYAVEFPQSARLKPLDLGNPFEAPGSTLRRRKTLPSILLGTDPETTAASSPAEIITTLPVTQRPSDDNARETPTPEAGLAVSAIKHLKRRSRSAGDLNWRNIERARQPERKRSEEIQFWRESFQGSVLRASGFLVPAPQQQTEESYGKKSEPLDELKTPTRQKPMLPSRHASHSRNPTLGTLESSSPFELRSNSAFGTEMSRDLEDRVAKLESNLQSFQRSLQRLQAEKNRRTVVVGDYPPVERCNDSRTPSMLAEDLHVPLAPSQYEYGYEPAVGPPSFRSFPTPHPLTPPQRVNEPPIPLLRTSSQQVDPSNLPRHDIRTASSTTAVDPSHTRSSSNKSPDPDFRSLYQMLSDERSARRKLESQMLGLRTEIQDLQYQVQTQSRLQSTRNSYMLSHDATMGSTRLQELLRETDESPGPSPVKEASTVGGAARIVSRFSGSTRQESEGGAGVIGREGEEEAQTPYEAYQTPLEEKSPIEFERNINGEMF